MLGLGRGRGAGLDGRGRDPELKEDSGLAVEPSCGGVSGGVGVLGGEGSASPWWACGGCGGG